MTTPTPDQLRAMADWQHKWAELAGSDEERQSRRRFADYLDRLASQQEPTAASGVVEIIEAGAMITRT